MKKKQKKPNVNNPVAKHVNDVNRPATMVDRKKRNDRGYEKHKGKSDEQ